MKRDKLFDFEIYEEGAIFDCSSVDYREKAKFFSNPQCLNMPLFTEGKRSLHFGANPEEAEAKSETEELLLLQLSYW